MQQPQIGVTVRKHDSNYYKTYLNRISEAGGLPIELAPDEPDSAAQVEQLDGLLLTGGDDVEPSRYGAERHPGTGVANPELDEMELAAVQLALRQGLPILAICRGHQVLNVALGGQLLQHIAGDSHRAHSTYGNPSRWHPVRIEEGCRLQQLFGTTELWVNSRHHQAVLPEMVAPSLRPAAYSPDGLVEAMESPGADWITSVQWHPERDEVIDRCRPLFDDFIRAASRAKARSTLQI
ncbi:MAG: gamma-glutamyl-gamma-aminobutyrate hydrolase family protein [Dehalococcoidia bacterium]